MHKGEQNSKETMIQKNPNKFLRIRQSQDIQLLKPQKILTTLKNNHFLFVDFADDKNVKILEPADPNQSEEQTHNIGNNYIVGLRNLSPHSYHMLQYISDNRAQHDHRKNIDDIVRARVQRIQARKKLKQQQEQKKKRKKLKNYNLSSNSQFNDSGKIAGKIHINSLRLSDNPQKIQQYLQKAHNDVITNKLVQGERQLHKSLSSAGNYKILMKNYSIQLQNMKKKRNIDLSHPNFDNNPKILGSNELSLLKLPEIKKIRYSLQKG